MASETKSGAILPVKRGLAYWAHGHKLGIDVDSSMQVCIRNYKKNGESFWNHFYLEPIFDESRVVEFYIGAP